VAPSGYTAEASIWPIVERLKACFEKELTARELMVKCNVSIKPGALPDFSAVDAAWIRVASVFQTSSFPNQTPVGRGVATTEAALLELTVLRCIETPRGGVLSAEKETEASRLALADKQAMLAAIKCCKISERSLGAWVPFGPGGGVYGGVQEVTVGIGE